ncbi:E3 ubiquitin-protein ligase Os04g0590900-like [Curcuma longa]|uniref:E3 ubiquitin-protein ligase Os04g0590900-like n=1 Tax=Curcuma longa TaxID=136217 RepID=UPI003D9E6B81
MFFLFLSATTMASTEIPLGSLLGQTKEPPPPPLELFSDVGGGRNFPPLVVAVIPVLVGAFLLISYYYTIVRKYCGSLHLHSPWWRSGGGQEFYDDRWREESWVFSESHGLDDASIAKLSVHVYGSGDGSVGVADCSVCLGKFRESEPLRLLPVCGHAFHLRCIDAWLKARANCPLCRANASPVTPPPESPPPAEPLLADGNSAAIFVVGDEFGVMRRSMSMEMAREQSSTSSVPLKRSFSGGRLTGSNSTLRL